MAIGEVFTRRARAMCGRFTLTPGAIDELADLFGLDGAAPAEGRLSLLPHWNIAPTQQVAVVRLLDGKRRLDMLRWGLLPPWTQDPKKGPPLINARADTVAEKPSFRHALKQRRCLVPADGFFEWAPPPEGAPKAAKKQPWWFRMKDEAPFAFAALWESWQPPDPASPPVASFTLVTTDANEVVAPVHHRMPVILPPEAFGRWLDPQVRDAKDVLPLLRPYPAALMKATPVSQRLNSAREDDPSLVEPPEAEAPSGRVEQPRLF
jgi:putative SOS response-associated peptidase YedK